MIDFIHSLPLWTAKIGAAVIFGGILLMAWVLPRGFIYQGAPDNSNWRDLRIWATLLILIQLGLYAIF
ncbi:MAG: hypothetical protein ACOCWZ_04375 [Spirochaetota bacterium]